MFNGIDHYPAYYLQLLVDILQEHNEYDTEYLQKTGSVNKHSAGDFLILIGGLSEK